jgi:hypothetical protein
MPKPADLPESLNAFAFRNAADIDSGRDFHAHMERLLRSMDSLIGPQPNGPALTFQSGATDAPAASLGTAANQAAKPGTRRFRLLGWLGWYLVTLVPMWVFLAADRQNGSQAFLDLFLVIVAGVVPAARGQRTWKQAALFGAAVGTGFTIAVLATAPRAPSADQFLGIGATSIGVGAVLTLISHAVGVYLRRRRTRPAVR